MLYKFKNRQVYGTTRPASGGKLELFKQWARPNILLRLADFYLYYAEACNEVDPGDPNVIEYLDRVRRRAGIPGYKELKEQGKKDIIGNQRNNVGQFNASVRLNSFVKDSAILMYVAG